jgi:hypothetical protein
MIEEVEFRVGLGFLASYTWSKNLSDAGSVTGSEYGVYAAYIQNPQNLKGEKSYAGQDTPPDVCYQLRVPPALRF